MCLEIAQALAEQHATQLRAAASRQPPGATPCGWLRNPAPVGNSWYAIGNANFMGFLVGMFTFFLQNLRATRATTGFKEDDRLGLFGL